MCTHNLLAKFDGMIMQSVHDATHLFVINTHESLQYVACIGNNELAIIKKVNTIDKHSGRIADYAMVIYDFSLPNNTYEKIAFGVIKNTESLLDCVHYLQPTRVYYDIVLRD